MVARPEQRRRLDSIRSIKRPSTVSRGGPRFLRVGNWNFPDAYLRWSCGTVTVTFFALLLPTASVHCTVMV